MQTREDVVKEMKELGTSPETIEKEILKLENEINDWTSGKIGIKQARLNSGLTLNVVSEETGISVKKLEWYEENPGEIEFDEATMLCELYGVKLDEVKFKADTVQKKEFREIYPAARRLCIMTDIKKELANIILAVTDDVSYSDRHLVNDILEIITEIEEEERINTNEICEGLDSLVRKSHLNKSLAGR